MAVVATAERGLIVYQLENQPSEFRRIDSPLKHQVTPPSLLLSVTGVLQRITDWCHLKRQCFYESSFFLSCSTAALPYLRTNRTNLLALHWEASRDVWPSTISTLQTRECRLWTRRSSCTFWRLFPKISLPRHIVNSVLCSCSVPKTTLPLSATGPMEPTQPLHKTSTLYVHLISFFLQHFILTTGEKNISRFHHRCPLFWLTWCFSYFHWELGTCVSSQMEDGFTNWCLF